MSHVCKDELSNLNVKNKQKKLINQIKKKSSFLTQKSHSQTKSEHTINQQANNIQKLKALQQRQCNCKKSKCLKLYCDCFAIGEYCNPICHCFECKNNESNKEKREMALKQNKERNPNAFTSRIIQQSQLNNHQRGCNCKKSGCQKKYCQCYLDGMECSRYCRCIGCENCNIFENKKICLNNKNIEKQIQQQKGNSDYIQKDQQQNILNQIINIVDLQNKLFNNPLIQLAIFQAQQNTQNFLQQNNKENNNIDQINQFQLI
ncbi:hypothetical protein IMG5_093910 [Ichthyophthirius multifiliis]|uniref:CRC domain-containing protein n=1 Tax=Ichthyophthirius multifiliis TaxID=5932 RepID=G0QRI8_ICHMU|nr:hypothetical protein IMG5_093910 [Ichthyophthirius multifiliis]EGR32168.1 hypothetical protein IMG5_093910 [Ichthyophthirius multifiliis]|eukprot:XP_004035654.1 hypothetical protein IMG5_093910 [Ichthyophthirius multifiliis]